MRLPRCFILILMSIVFISACSEVSETNTRVIQVFTANKDNVNKSELFAIFSDGAISKLSAELTVGGNVIDVAVSPDLQFVAYIADQEVDDKFELFVVPVSGGDVIKLSGTSASGGNVNILVGAQKSAINWSPDSTRIAYVASQDIAGLEELFVSTVDGTSNIKVSGVQTAGSVGVGVSDDIQWSPNSAFIAYSAEQEVNGLKELFVSTPDGLVNRKISGVMVAGVGAGVEPAQIFWSPDSNFIAYSARQDSTSVLELYVSTPDGLSNVKASGVMVVGGNVATSPAPFWSPDSSQVTYLADQDVDGELELFAGTPDGLVNNQLSGALPVGAGATLSTESIQYSPDSGQIIYLATQDNTFNELFISQADGANNNRVSDDVLVGSGSIMQAAWSPDGSRIAYAATLDAEGPKLFVVSPGGTSNISLTANVPGAFATIDSLEWSPDGTKIAYVYSDNDLATDGQLNIADVASATSIVVTNTLTKPALDARDVRTIKWSDDSARLTYLAHDDANVNELYVIQAESGTIDKLSGDLATDGFVGALF